MTLSPLVPFLKFLLPDISEESLDAVGASESGFFFDSGEPTSLEEDGDLSDVEQDITFGTKPQEEFPSASEFQHDSADSPLPEEESTQKSQNTLPRLKLENIERDQDALHNALTESARKSDKRTNDEVESYLKKRNVYIGILSTLLTASQRGDLEQFILEQQPHLREDVLDSKGHLRIVMDNLQTIIHLYYLYYLAIDLEEDKVDFSSDDDWWICIMGIIVHCERRFEIIQGILTMPPSTQAAVMNIMKIAIEKWPSLHEGDATVEDEYNDDSSQESWGDDLAQEGGIDDIEASHIPFDVNGEHVAESPALHDLTEHDFDTFNLRNSVDGTITPSRSRHTSVGKSHLSKVEQFMEAISPKPKSGHNSPIIRSPRAKSPIRHMSMYRNRMLVYKEKMKEKIAESEKRIENNKQESKIKELQETIELLNEEKESYRDRYEALSSQMSDDFESFVQTPKEFRNSWRSSASLSNTGLFTLNNADNGADSVEVEKLIAEKSKLELELEAQTQKTIKLESKVSQQQHQIDQLNLDLGILRMFEPENRSLKSEIEALKSKAAEYSTMKGKYNNLKSENENLIDENSELYNNVQELRRKYSQLEEKHKEDIRHLTTESREMQMYNERMLEKISEIQSALDSKSEQVLYLEGEVVELKETLSDAREAISQLTTSTKTEDLKLITTDVMDEPFTTELKQKMSRLEDDYVRLTKETNEYHRKVEEQAELISSLKIEIAAVRIENDKLVSQLAFNQPENNWVPPPAGHIATANENQQSLSQLSESLSKAHSEVEDLKHVAMENEALKDLVQQLEDETQALKSKIHLKEEEISGFVDANSKWSHREAQLSSANELSAIEIENLNSKIEHLSQKESEHIQVINTLRDVIQKSQSDIESLQLVLNDTLRDLQAQSDKVCALQAENEGLLLKSKQLEANFDTIQRKKLKLKEKIIYYRKQLHQSTGNLLDSMDESYINSSSTVKLLRDEIMYLRKENDIIRKNMNQLQQNICEYFPGEEQRTAPPIDNITSSSRLPPSGITVSAASATGASNRSSRSSSRSSRHALPGRRDETPFISFADTVDSRRIEAPTYERIEPLAQNNSNRSSAISTPRSSQSSVRISSARDSVHKNKCNSNIGRSCRDSSILPKGTSYVGYRVVKPSSRPL